MLINATDHDDRDGAGWTDCSRCTRLRSQPNPNRPASVPPPKLDPRRAAGGTLVAFGLLAAFGLLVAFALVAQAAVRKGNARQQANELLIATWRCNALKTPRLRETCRRRFQLEQPADSAGVRLHAVDTVRGTP